MKEIAEVFFNGNRTKIVGNVTVKLFIIDVERVFKCPTKPLNLTIEEAQATTTSSLSGCLQNVVLINPIILLYGLL